jgi:hypothetical protein
MRDSHAICKPDVAWALLIVTMAVVVIICHRKGPHDHDLI